MIYALDTLVVDIETTYSTSAVLRKRFADKITHPGNMSKADTIAKWEVETKPLAINEAMDRTALDGGYGRIVAIGYKLRDEPSVVISGAEELSLLTDFAAIPAHHDSLPIVVGHSCIGFDIPFLWKRAIIHGVRLPSWLPFNPKPWSERVFDTMHAWCGGQAYVSLDELADILGVPRAETIPGGEVPRAFQEGRIDEIVAHCHDDIETTYAIYNAMKAAGL